MDHLFKKNFQDAPQILDTTFAASQFIFNCSIFLLPDDIVYHLAGWLEFWSVLALKDSCKNFRRIVKKHFSDIHVSKVEFINRDSLSAAASSFNIFVRLRALKNSGTASTRNRSSTVRMWCLPNKTAIKFWNFFWEHPVHIAADNLLLNNVRVCENDCSKPQDWKFSTDNRCLYLQCMISCFSPMPELKIESKKIESVTGICNALKVNIACPNLKELVWIGGKVRNLGLLVPTMYPNLLQFVDPLSLRSFRLQIHPFFFAEQLDKNVWGIDNLKRCTNLTHFTLDVLNNFGNVFHVSLWSSSLNDALEQSIYAQKLSSFSCKGALNAIHHQHKFWTNLLGFTNDHVFDATSSSSSIFSTSPSSASLLVPSKLSTVSYEQQIIPVPGLSLHFDGQDTYQGTSASDFRKSKAHRMVAMARQFAESPRLQELSFNICLVPLLKKTSAVNFPDSLKKTSAINFPDLHCYHLNNLLALKSMEFF